MAEKETWRRTARSHYWREEDARGVVGAWRKSGDTLAGFCRSHGLSSQRLARWSARLGRDEPVQFHPVRLTGTGTGSTRSMLEVELPGGATVRLPAGFAVDDLRRILSAFETAPGC